MSHYLSSDANCDPLNVKEISLFENRFSIISSICASMMGVRWFIQSPIQPERQTFDWMYTSIHSHTKWFTIQGT